MDSPRDWTKYGATGVPVLPSHLYPAGDAGLRGGNLWETLLPGASGVLDSRIAAPIERTEMRNARRPIP